MNIKCPGCQNSLKRDTSNKYIVFYCIQNNCFACQFTKNPVKLIYYLAYFSSHSGFYHSDFYNINISSFLRDRRTVINHSSNFKQEFNLFFRPKRISQEEFYKIYTKINGFSNFQ